MIASISGYGPVGPERATPGLDQIAQGMSGLMSLTGAGEHTPMRVGVPIIDTVSGIVAAYGIAAALAGRNATGQGTHIQTSLLESALAVLTFQAQNYLSTGEVPRPQGNNHSVLTPYGTFATADHPINLAIGSLNQWQTLCEVLGEPALAGHPDYADPFTRLSHRDELQADIERLLAAHPSAYWIPVIRAAGIPCGPIHTLDQVFADSQVRAIDMVQQVGDLPLLRGPLWADDQPVPVHSAPPELGAHTAETLTALGLSREDLDNLAQRAIIGIAAPGRTGRPAEPEGWRGMSLDCIVVGHVATITITNPAKRNAMTPAMWQALPPLLDRLAADDDVRVLVLTGAGDAFCAGADIGALPDLRHGGRDLATEAEQALAAFPKPTVAAIRGYCVGGGVQLATACDLRLAADTARFGVTPAKIGIVYPVTALARLVQLIGPAHTTTLLFTADLIDAPTAHHYGLIERPVPDAELDQRLSTLTATLAARSQLTLQATKDIIGILTGPAVNAAAEHQRRWQHQVVSSGEAAEGITAFLERRQPAFVWTRPLPA